MGIDPLIYPNANAAVTQAYNLKSPVNLGYTQMAPKGDYFPPGAMFSIGSSLGNGWAGYSGGLMGLSQMYGGLGWYGGLIGGGLMMPGPQSMGLIGMAGAGAMGVMDNTIEVAGAGMGKDKTYKMFPGELMAVYSLLKDGKNVSPEDMQKQLKEKYGIEAEIKTIDGQKALVNSSTGNVMISDGNGNSIMDMGDMKFDDALKTIKEKYGITPEDFAKMYDKTQGGMGATTGMNMPMGGGYGMMSGGMGIQGLGGYYPFGIGQMGGMMGGYGIWGDPMWQNSIFGIFASAMRYSGIYGGMY
jgi:hypothetical protein